MRLITRHGHKSRVSDLGHLFKPLITPLNKYTILSAVFNRPYKPTLSLDKLSHGPLSEKRTSLHTTIFVEEDNRIKAVLKVFNGTVELFYKQDEEPTYPPSMNRPDYNRGFFYCGVCGVSWMGMEKCPNCSVKLREKSRKKKDNNSSNHV